MAARRRGRRANGAVAEGVQQYRYQGVNQIYSSGVPVLMTPLQQPRCVIHQGTGVFLRRCDGSRPADADAVQKTHQGKQREYKRGRSGPSLKMALWEYIQESGFNKYEIVH